MSISTMSDVAIRAGVSLSTVSYALSGKRTISEATRQRVLTAIEELDFHPNQMGRALASQRSNTIALLFPALTRGIGELQLEFVTSAAQTAGSRGYSFLLSISPDEDEEVLRLSGRGITDGLILMDIKMKDARVDSLRNRRFPFAMIGHCEDNEGVSYVDVDFVGAAYDALTYLASLGHRRVAFLGASEDLMDAGYGYAVRSYAGFTQAITEHNLDGTWHPCDANPHSAYAVVEDLLQKSPDVTALVTGHHEATGGMLQAARELGRQIPADLTVIAMTSVRQAENFIPYLTSMDFPAADMGRLGAELLIRQIEAEGGEVEPVHRLLRTELTVRKSSGPAPRPR